MPDPEKQDAESGEWKDPWLEAVQEQEARRFRTHSGPVPPDCRTRRDCIKHGALTFGLVIGVAAMLSATSAGFLYASDAPGRVSNLHAAILRPFYQYLFVVVPPAIVLGGATGYDAYRLAMGIRKWREVGCWVWGVAVVVFGPWIVVFWLQYRFRQNCLIEGRGGGWILPLVYSVLALLCLCALPSVADLVPMLIIVGIMAVFIGDCLVVKMVSRWCLQRRLVPPPTHKLQFSLGSMMIAVLALGAYGSGIALMLKA